MNQFKLNAFAVLSGQYSRAGDVHGCADKLCLRISGGLFDLSQTKEQQKRNLSSCGANHLF